jgi:hypothetical protein
MTARRTLIAALVPLLAVLLARQAILPAPLMAQGATFNLPGTTVGSAPITGATWNFDGGVDGTGPWATLVVTNVQWGFRGQERKRTRLNSRHPPISGLQSTG